MIFERLDNIGHEIISRRDPNNEESIYIKMSYNFMNGEFKFTY